MSSTVENELSDEKVQQVSAHEEPTQEQIAELAYEYWVERGSPHGSHDEDWHRAEAELRERGTLNKSAHA